MKWTEEDYREFAFGILLGLFLKTIIGGMF